MKRLITCSLIFMVSFMNAQEKNDKDSYTWFQSKYVKFKPGRSSEARELLSKYLYKANEISGRLVLTFESDTGDWDHIAYLHLKDRPEQLGSPNDEIERKW